MNNIKKPLFVTGTNTDIGKTVITAGLACVSTSLKNKTAVVKPVQTGTDEYEPDLAFIHRMCPELIALPARLETAYSFGYPASPHLTAKQEGITIQIDNILSTLQEVSNTFTPDQLIVEGAGGALVPITDDYLMVDLIRDINAQAIIVTTTGLGTINHTLMTVEVLRTRKIQIAGIIFNKASENPSLIEADNIETIINLAKVPLLGVVSKCDEISQEILTKQLLTPAIKELFTK